MPASTITGPCHDLLFVVKRFALGPYYVRRTRLYCVGTGKSGTHSVAAMFSRNVRARHEPRPLQLIEKILARHDGVISDAALAEWVRARDRELALEVDSSALNCGILDILVREFSDARFVLTLRDCYSWLNSRINHTLKHETDHPLWQRLLDLRGGTGVFVHAPEERLLKENGLHTLDGYFSNWAAHNQQVLTLVPPERLLIVRTGQITPRAFEIADFAGLPRRLVRPDHTHAYANPVEHSLVRELDRGFLEAKVEQHCRPLMTRFFPEIKSLDDARL